MNRLRDRAPGVRGVVTVEAIDQAGRVVDRRTFRNTYTLLGATEHAKALAGVAANVALTHIGIGQGGATLTAADVATGWTGATLDPATFREGTASLAITAAVSTTVVGYNATAVADYNATLATAVELWLRLGLRGRFDLAASELRIYTGTGTTRYFRASLATIEAALGVPFQDATWKLARIPIASFTVGAGAPDWAHVSGVGIAVAANGSGAATLNFDAVRTIEPIDTTNAATSVPNEVSRPALASLTRAGRVVTATAVWMMAESVGQFYVAGLYAGTTLVSILPFTYYKGQGLVLRIVWTLTPNGGS